LVLPHPEQGIEGFYWNVAEYFNFGYNWKTTNKRRD
jgi:hypothetical protein